LADDKLAGHVFISAVGKEDCAAGGEGGNGGEARAEQNGEEHQQGANTAALRKTLYHRGEHREDDGDAAGKAAQEAGQQAQQRGKEDGGDAGGEPLGQHFDDAGFARDGHQGGDSADEEQGVPRYRFDNGPAIGYLHQRTDDKAYHREHLNIGHLGKLFKGGAAEELVKYARDDSEDYNNENDYQVFLLDRGERYGLLEVYRVYFIALIDEEEHDGEHEAEDDREAEGRPGPAHGLSLVAAGGYVRVDDGSRSAPEDEGAKVVGVHDEAGYQGIEAGGDGNGEHHDGENRARDRGRAADDAEKDADGKQREREHPLVVAAGENDLVRDSLHGAVDNAEAEKQGYGHDLEVCAYRPQQNDLAHTHVHEKAANDIGAHHGHDACVDTPLIADSY